MNPLRNIDSRHRDLRSRFGWLAVLLALGTIAGACGELRPSKTPTRTIFILEQRLTAASRRAAQFGLGFFNRSPEQVEKDIALVKEQFNQISPENDLKWALIHPREGAEGYNFGPADAFVNFGLSNQMYLVGHTLVWHGQTPSWVFRGTNPPPELTNTSSPAATGGTNVAGTNGAGSSGFGRGAGGFNWTPRLTRGVAPADARSHSHRRRTV